VKLDRSVIPLAAERLKLVVPTIMTHLDVVLFPTLIVVVFQIALVVHKGSYVILLLVDVLVTSMIQSAKLAKRQSDTSQSMVAVTFVRMYQLQLLWCVS